METAKAFVASLTIHLLFGSVCLLTVTDDLKIAYHERTS